MHSRKTLRKFMWFGILALGLVWTQDALALSRTGARYLRSCQSTIRVAGLKVIKAYETGPVTRQVIAHWKNLRSNLSRVVRSFNRIPAMDRSDPGVQQTGRTIKALVAHFKIIDSRVRAHGQAQANQKRKYFAFGKRYGNRANTSAMDILHAVARDPKQGALERVLPGLHLKRTPQTDQEDRARAARYKAFVRSVTEIRKACSGEFRGVRNYRGYSLSFDGNYELWCKLANQSDKLIRDGLKGAAAHKIGLFVKEARDMERKLKSHPGTGLMTVQADRVMHPESTITAFKAMLAYWHKVTGIAIDPKPYLDQLRQATTATQNEIKAQARKNRQWVKKNFRTHFGAAERKAKRAIKSGYHARVKWSGIRGRRWELSKNNYGVPEYRYRSGIVIFKRRGEKLCRAMEFSYRQAYKGHGRFQRAATLHTYDDGVLFVTCR